MKKVFLLIATLILTFSVLSAKEQYIYTQISHNDGLTSTVNSIYKEMNGKIWIATQNGLFRSNGQSLQFIDDPGLKDRTIHQISADDNGRLWVLTDRGIFVKKDDDDLFRRIGTENDRKPFYQMLSTKDAIWFGSIGSIYRFDRENEELSLYLELKDRPSFVIKSILTPKEGSILCCSHDGMILVDTISGELSDAPYGSYSEVSAGLVDSKGRIWLAFYNNGIEVYSPEGVLLKTYRSESGSLSNNIVLCLTERYSTIWAGTDGGGINIISFDDDRVRNLNHIAGDQSSFPAHSIKSIHTDSYGNIWAGSIRDGLIGISSSKMKTISDVHIGMNTGLSSPAILCLYKDIYSDDIWIGTDGEGLNRFNPLTNRFTHFKSTLKTKVVSIASFSKDELVISVYGDRFWIFNKKSGTIREMRVDDESINYQMKFAGKALNVFNEPDGKILIVGNTINRYDRQSCKCTPILPDHGAKTLENILAIGLTEDGIWFHDTQKVYLLETGSVTMKTVGQISDDSLIRCGRFEGKDRIWLATSTGVKLFDLKTSSFQDIDTNLFSEASAIVCDRTGRVWIGTKEHLYAFITESGNFAMFGRSDGASPNEYLSKSCLLAKNGDILMGGVSGLLHIDATYEIDTAEEPSVMLSGVTVEGEKLLPDRKGRYIMPRHRDEITIRSATKETDIFRKKIYRFSFSDNGGTFQTSNPYLSLKRPRSGKYAVTISCTKRDGRWTEPVKLLDLEVLRPWYLSWWFICSVFIMAAGIIITFMISTERRKIERLRMEQKEQEQKSYEEKVQLLINMSHELRTPLTLIMAPLKRLLKESTSETTDIPTLNRMYRQSRRMKTILNMVLELRKMEAGKSHLKIETTDTCAWITEVAGDFIDEERSEGINITIDVADDAQELRIDRQKCETVLSNILMNAIKHSKSGDTISIKAEKRGEMIRISISDQGPGLGDADMAQIFTRFYQSNSEKYGSGIGLSYSKILVEMHGGEIGTYNNEDKGATFWWEIPVSPESSSAEAIAGRAYLNELMGYNPGLDIVVPECDSFRTENMTLLLVDDNRDLLEFLREALSNEFAEILTAQSGNKALKIIASGKMPDIIVSDVNMPDGDGYQLCSALKNNEKYNHIPVVLLTARGEEQSQSDSYKLGADGFIPKPFEMETLTELLRGLLRKRSEVKKRYLSNEDNTAEFGSEEEAFIIRFNKIVSEHLGDPDLDQQLICRELGVSRALLYNKMKAIAGTGAKEYITRIRIEKAKNLMENPSLSIADIAEMTGFTSQSYFSTAFKSQTGMTPSQYRQKDKS